MPQDRTGTDGPIMSGESRPTGPLIGQVGHTCISIIFYFRWLCFSSKVCVFISLIFLFSIIYFYLYLSPHLEQNCGAPAQVDLDPSAFWKIMNGFSVQCGSLSEPIVLRQPEHVIASLSNRPVAMEMSFTDLFNWRREADDPTISFWIKHPHTSQLGVETV